MATVVAPLEIQQRTGRARARDQGLGLLLVSVLTPFALAVHGYHPYAEDGGLYVAGVKRLLNPELYPHGAAFVLEPMRFSLFAPLVAGIVRLSHLELPTVLLALHLASIWVTLYAAWMLSARCWPQLEARAGGLVLLACWLSLPVAGTALYLMDPYLTARSISTPCSLFALAAALDVTAEKGGLRRGHAWVLLCGSLALAAAMHPLMAAYAVWTVFVLACVRSGRAGWTLALSAATIAFAACLQHGARSESNDYIRIALTRTYWFLGRWAWYELAGLVAPLGIVAAFGWHASCKNEGATHVHHALVRTALVLGLTAIAVALLYAHADSASHLVARMQPLRAFQIVYLIMVLALGAALGQWILRRSAWRWCAAIILLAGIMFAAQRTAFPNTDHVELPSQAPRNLWAQAFIWVRGNTPADALFALDADYINASGEDAESFRAIAERSALPDYSKDGGEASIAPELTAAWTVGQSAQQRLSAPHTGDMQRVAQLRPLGVSWIVLQATATTGFDCPYSNAVVKVCRLP